MLRVALELHLGREPISGCLRPDRGREARGLTEHVSLPDDVDFLGPGRWPRGPADLPDPMTPTPTDCEHRPTADASRARIIAAADEARRRLERDLHDGAQQRLVSATLTLGQAKVQVRGTPAEVLVTDALEQLQRALTELRDLARGIHPAVLSERGLAAALESLVARSPLPVELRVPRQRAEPGGRSGDLLHRRRGPHEHRQARPSQPRPRRGRRRERRAHR